MTTKIDEQRAKEIAIRFLEQYHSVNGVSAVLKKGTWMIAVTIGMPNKQLKQVMVDAESGKILGYTILEPKIAQKQIWNTYASLIEQNL